MTENSNERLIYLKDLMFVVLRGWRVLVITALVFALLFGGAKAALEMQGMEAKNAAAKAEYTLVQAEYEKNVKSAEKAVADAKNKVEEYQHYIDSSIYMNLDPDRFYEMVYEFFIDVDEELEKYQDILSREYRYLLTDDDVVIQLAESLNIKPSHMRELYTVSQNEEGTILRITGICVDELSGEKLLTEVEKLVASASEEIFQTTGEHAIIILQDGVTEQSDSSIEETQNIIKNKLKEYETQLKEAEAVEQSLVAPVAQYLSVADVAKHAAIIAIIGALIGCVITTAYLWIRHIFGYKVYSASILNAVTKVKILGCIAKNQVKNPVDRVLMKLEGRDVTDPEVRSKLLAADIRNRCGDISRLLVTGDAVAPSRKHLVDALQNAMQGIQVEDHGSLFASVTAVESLATCDAVLLVEQCECSLYANVAKEAEMVTDYSKKLIGCVLLDG